MYEDVQYCRQDEGDHSWLNDEDDHIDYME